jgi:methionyl-tRNA formyltransferase
MSFRIALFCSHYYGLSLLETLLSLRETYPEIEIVGVASDDPTKPWAAPKKRIWQYPHTKEEEDMVMNLASRHGIPVWRGRVRTEEFQEKFTKNWMPDVCYMSVFGQRIPEPMWSYPLYGFYNFHPCAGRMWPSNVGPHAVEEMTSNGETQGAIAMHAVDNEFDHGPLVAFSEFFPVSPQERVLEMFRRTSSSGAELMAWHISEILGISVSQTKPRIVVDEQMDFIRASASSAMSEAKRVRG